jgi:hypothetical protein
MRSGAAGVVPPPARVAQCRTVNGDRVGNPKAPAMRWRQMSLRHFHTWQRELSPNPRCLAHATLGRKIATADVVPSRCNSGELQSRGKTVMAETQAPADKAAKSKSSKAKSSINWPVWAAAALTITFVVGVWVNNYRVSHAQANPAPITATK